MLGCVSMSSMEVDEGMDSNCRVPLGAADGRGGRGLKGSLDELYDV